MSLCPYFIARDELAPPPVSNRKDHNPVKPDIIRHRDCSYSDDAKNDWWPNRARSRELPCEGDVAKCPLGVWRQS